MRSVPDLHADVASQPVFSDEAKSVVNKLAKLSKSKLMELMNINEALAKVNFHRYKNFHSQPTVQESTAALHAFHGEVYWGIESETMDLDDILFANDALRILSGMYGYLKPMDRIQPYRLEMGTKISIGRRPDLYAYWSQLITSHVLSELEAHSCPEVVNLASEEYSRVIDQKNLPSPMINIEFKERREGKLRSIQTYMKRARGNMARQIVQKKIANPEDLKMLDVNGYQYSSDWSNEYNWLFIKEVS